MFARLRCVGSIELREKYADNVDEEDEVDLEQTRKMMTS